MAQDLAAVRREISVLRRESDAAVEARRHRFVMTTAERHEHAVEQTLCWAQEAAARNDAADALAWLAVVEAVDGELPLVWQRARASWLARGASVGPRQETQSR
jgi:hypothetical protein